MTNNTQDSVKDRITRYLKMQNITQAQFCARVGLSSGHLGAMRKSFQPNTINKIVIEFPLLNIIWLLTGEGEMLKGNAPKESIHPTLTASVSIPKEVWDVIRDQAASLKAKDEQMNEFIASMKARDGQLAKTLDRLEEKIDKRGDSVGNAKAAVG